MEKEFVPYEIALALKELGFDEPCMCFQYDKNSIVRFVNMSDSKFNNLLTYTIISNNPTLICNNDQVLKPTYSQAFEFFRDKYNLHHSISTLQRSCKYHFKIRTFEYESDLKPFGDSKIIFEDGPRKKYEDIELDCLTKLIEIVKK